MVVLAVVLAIALIVALAAWPVVRASARRRDPRDQPAVTDRGVVPPPHPDDPVPGSETDRRRKGRA